MEQAYDISRNKLPRLDIILLAVTNDCSSHRDITFKGCNNVGSLLFLIPTNSCIEHQDGDDDSKINPVAEAGSDENSDFHDCKRLAYS